MTVAGQAATRAVTPVPGGHRVRWTRAKGPELALLGAYFGIVIAAGDIVNVRLGVEAMTGVVVFAAIVISRAPMAFLRDWWFLIVGLVLWNISSIIAAQSPFPLQLDFMLQGDRILFFGRDPTVVVQHALAPRTGLNALDWLTAIVYNMHLSEPYVAGYFLWRVNRALYLRFAAAVLALLVLGFVTFIVFPAIPPWMATKTYRRLPDVINRFGPVLAAHPLPFHGTPIFYLFRLTGDRVAAFPSEHAAFPMLELLAFASLRRRWLTLGLLLWVLAVLFSIVYLGEHWVVDALAGYVYAIVIWVAIGLFCARPSRAAQGNQSVIRSTFT